MCLIQGLYQVQRRIKDRDLLTLEICLLLVYGVIVTCICVAKEEAANLIFCAHSYDPTFYGFLMLFLEKMFMLKRFYHQVS